LRQLHLLVGANLCVCPSDLETAQNMIDEGFEVEMISKMTGLDVETINKLGTE